MEILVLRFPLLVMARKQGVLCPGVAQITWAELFQCWWALPWHSLPCFNQYLWKPAWPSLKVQQFVVFQVWRLSQKSWLEMRGCCCGREEEHPAELQHSSRAAWRGEKGATRALWQQQCLCSSWVPWWMAARPGRVVLCFSLNQDSVVSRNQF